MNDVSDDDAYNHSAWVFYRLELVYIAIRKIQKNSVN